VIIDGSAVWLPSHRSKDSIFPHKCRWQLCNRR